MNTVIIPETTIIMVMSNRNSADNISPRYQQHTKMSRTSSPAALDENAAVCVRNGFKGYGKGAPVLSDFNMTVPSGTIYSLLGSSGCGKTTMLSCCVGISKLDSGQVHVFGHKPGTKASGVPGSRVGFMPQDLSVYEQLTIQESLNFYGRIYGMERDQMRESTKFLIDFLDLPVATRRIGTLSGGQKRRVSMALALIHDPELLILDEPTVGVDPLLRETIWNHLVELVTSGRTTVIITTHYVEEARQSNTIGIMRNGRLLVEKSPQALLKEFNTDLLEDIVLSLSRMDREERRRANSQTVEASVEDKKNPQDSGIEKMDKDEWSLKKFMSRRRKVGHGESTLVKEDYSSSPVKSEEVNDDNGENEKGNGHIVKTLSPSELLQGQENIRRNESTTLKRLYALLIKNYIILMRNIGFVIFIFFVPATQVILICLTIGSDPRELKVGIINPESCDFEGKNWRHQVMNECPMDSSDDMDKKEIFSCFYLAHLPIGAFILQREASEDTALSRIQNGYTYGYIEFPENFTGNVVCRLTGLCDEDEGSGSSIMLELDMSRRPRPLFTPNPTVLASGGNSNLSFNVAIPTTCLNKQIGHTIKRIFLEAYVKAMERVQANCKSTVSEDTLESATNVPYNFKKPVYGKDDTSFIEFLAPSILLGILFFFPLCTSGVSYITEKKIGTLDRALVAGVGTAELMGGFLIFQVGILVIQTGVALLILTLVFKIDIIGSIYLAVILTILVGISGMSAGFLIAMFCTEEVQAVLLAIGTFFPNVLLAGMVWPLEGMHKYLQYVSYLLPCTLSCESMRSIFNRGWPLTHRGVWPGFISTFAWISVYWILALLVNKQKSKR